MLTPVLMKGSRPVVLPLESMMADNFLDAFVIGVAAEISTGWPFTNSLIDINKVKGVHVMSDGMDVVLLAEEYSYAREQSQTRDI